jgi:hypothetical protein
LSRILASCSPISGNRLSGIGRLLRIRHINHDHDNRFPAELHEVEQRLRDNRPALSALQLDAIKLQTMASATRKSQTLFAKKKGTFMKSRVAVVMVLALGVFMSGTGATLAVTGLASSSSASSAQYPKPESAHTLGTNDGNTSSVKPASTEAVVTPVETQAVRQVANSSGGSLPFTGFLAIPVLIVGVGLLGAGVAMRLRIRSGNNVA